MWLLLEVSREIVVDISEPEQLNWNFVAPYEEKKSSSQIAPSEDSFDED